MHEPAPELEDVGRRADQPRGLEHARPAAGPSTARPRRRPGSTPRARGRPCARSARRRRGAATRRGRAEFRQDRHRDSASSGRPYHHEASVNRRENEPWADLLEQGRADERLVHEGVHERTPTAHRRRRRSTSARRSRRRCTASASTTCTPIRPRRSRRHSPGRRSSRPAPRPGKSLCFQLPTLEVLSTDRDRPRAVPVSDEGARPGPGPRASRVRASQRDPTRDLRRRYASQRARRDPQAQQPHPHQPGHAPRRDPPPPRQLGRPAREPRVRRRRRGARLSRRVRLARRQRAAAAAARRGDPRHRAAVPARERDDRQPDRARRRSSPACPTSISSTTTRRPGRNGARCDVESAAARRGARRSRLGALRGGRGVLRADPRGRPDDLLHEVAQGDRADPQARPRPA